MDVDKPKAAKPAAAPAAPPAADDGWTTTPVTQNPFMLQLLGEQGAAALQSTMPAPTPEPATPRGYLPLPARVSCRVVLPRVFLTVCAHVCGFWAL
jgi:hypothetical protein